MRLRRRHQRWHESACVCVCDRHLGSSPRLARHDVEHGPFEYIIVDFPGGRMTGDLAPVLRQSIAAGTIRILDMMFIRKDANGHIEPLELNQLDAEAALPYEELDGEIDDLINLDDIQIAAADLPPDSIALVLVWEDVWATRFADAVRSAHGRVIANEHIPEPVMEAAMKATAPNMWLGEQGASTLLTKGHGDYATTPHSQ